VSVSDSDLAAMGFVVVAGSDRRLALSSDCELLAVPCQSGVRLFVITAITNWMTAVLLPRPLTTVEELTQLVGLLRLPEEA
jgi:hypothetical protein